MKTKLFTPNFTRLLLGQISSLFGNYTLKFAISMYILEQTGSAAVFAGLLALAMLPTILLSPFGGILADRADRRAIMVALDGLSGGCVLAAALLFPGAGGLPVTAGLLVALSVLGAFESPTVQACVPQMLDGEAVMQGNALVGQVSSLAGLVTPFLGSLVYTAWGLTPVLYGTAVCFWVTALLECGIRLPPRPRSERMSVRRIIREDLAAGLRFLRREEPGILRLLLLAGLVSLFVAGTVVVGFPYLVRTVLGLSAEHYGAAESAMGTAAVAGSLCAGLTARRFRPVYLAGIFFGFGVCLLAAGAVFPAGLPVFGCYLVLLAAFCACQFGCSLFSTCAITLIQQRTPPELMGKIMSCVFTLSLCAQPVGQLVYGGLFDLCGARAHWVLLPSGLAVCGIGLACRRFFLAWESGPAGRPQA